MAWIIQLTDGTTTADLNDGTTTYLRIGGFQAPPPQRRLAIAGENLSRHGGDLMARQYGNRTVTVNLEIKGTNATALTTAVGTIWSILRKADEYARMGLGTQVQLKYQWDGAASPVYFNVLEGVFDLGADLHSPYLSLGTRIQNAQVELLCEPFAVGTAETLENWLKDPSFEIAGSALADWTASLGTATGTRVASNAKWGTASLRVLKATAAGANTADYSESFTSPGTAAFSASIWGTLSGSGTARLLLLWRDSAGAQVGSNEASSTAGTFQITIANATPPGSAPTGTLAYVLRQVVGDTQTGTIYWDNGYLTTATSLPTAWISGRDVVNHFDDNGQAHINYLDIYGVPGDVPAPLQVKATEVEAHTDFWLGARMAGRQQDASIFIEGEAFSGWAGSGVLASASNGSAGTLNQPTLSTSASAPKVVTYAITAPPQGIFRVLASVAQDGASTLGARMGIGYSYGGITLTPSVAADYTTLGTTNSVLTIIDLGVLTIPPIETPQEGVLGTFTLRLAMYGSSTGAGTNRLDCDWLMLLPIDQGMVYANKTSAADVVMADSRSVPPAAYLLTGSALKSIPANQVGSPPEAHPQGMRLYFAGSRGGTAPISDGWTVKAIYQPRYLHVS